jgi:hypothetical protein
LRLGPLFGPTAGSRAVFWVPSLITFGFGVCTGEIRLIAGKR